MIPTGALKCKFLPVCCCHFVTSFLLVWHVEVDGIRALPPPPPPPPGVEYSNDHLIFPTERRRLSAPLFPAAVASARKKIIKKQHWHNFRCVLWVFESTFLLEKVSPSSQKGINIVINGIIVQKMATRYWCCVCYPLVGGGQRRPAALEGLLRFSRSISHN